MKTRLRKPASVAALGMRLGAVAFVAISVPTAQAADAQAFRLGYRLLADCKANDIEFCGGYISGVLDVFAALHAGTGNPEFRLCLPADATPAKLADVVVAYIEHNGTERADAAGSVVSAIREAYPCR